MAKINYIEKNIHGAYVIHGEIGIRQYYYCTKKDAIADYRKECEKEKIFVNQD